MSIGERCAQVKEKIRETAYRAGRNPEAVRLVAVSKTRSAAEVSEAFKAGLQTFGENYVQELTVKAAEIHEPVEWHFIGHLQSNKVKYIAGLVSMVHSVDRLTLAEEIDRQWGRLGSRCDVLVQVNISGEATKSGTTEEEVMSLVRDIARLPNVRVRGLMTMPPFFDNPEAARPFFSELRVLSQAIKAEGIPGVEMDELSMGMSGDFEVAIQEGATLVRIGTAIFGER